MKYLKQSIRVRYIFYRFVKIVYALRDLNNNKNKGDLQIVVFLFQNLTFLNTWINFVKKGNQFETTCLTLSLILT